MYVQDFEIYLTKLGFFGLYNRSKVVNNKMFGNKYFKMDLKEFHKGIYLSHFVVVGTSHLGSIGVQRISYILNTFIISY